jgi:hypothetical protein
VPRSECLAFTKTGGRTCWPQHHVQCPDRCCIQTFSHRALYFLHSPWRGRVHCLTRLPFSPANYANTQSISSVIGSTDKTRVEIVSPGFMPWPNSFISTMEISSDAMAIKTSARRKNKGFFKNVLIFDHNNCPCCRISNVSTTTQICMYRRLQMIDDNRK